MDGKDEELISIVVPVYKVEKYIDRCMESILNQTYTNMEVILVDDGSPDACGEICDRYAERHSFIKAVHQENRGLSLARKRGLQEASGTYVMFVDSDDYIHECMLDVMYQAAKKDDCDLVACQYAVTDDAGEKNAAIRMEEEYLYCKGSSKSAQEMYVTRYLNASTCGKLIAIDLARTIDFKSGLAVGEEIDVASQLIKSAKNICILNIPYYYYYCRTDSISRHGYNPKYYNSFRNYIRLRDNDCSVFPELKNYIIAFYTEFEMSILTAMCRNRKFDKAAITELRGELKYGIKALLRNKGTRFYYKVSALMILYVPWVFIAMFSVSHRLFRR